VVICLERGADLHMAQLMPLLLTVSCFSKIQIGFAFLIPAHPGSPGEGSVQRVCVCACVCVCILYGGRQLPVPLYSTVNPSNVNWQLTSEVLHWVHQRVTARCSDCRFVIVLFSRRFCAVCIRILARRKFCSCSKRSIRSHI